MAETTAVFRTLDTLLSELVDGAGPAAAWALNPGDPGLFASLDRLSAARASAHAPGGGAPIVAHVDHLRYGLSLLNEWHRGDPDPFSSADYTGSWRIESATDDEWARARQALRAEVSAWQEALRNPRRVSDEELAGVVASVVHLAYHLGAIRQIDRTARGPDAAGLSAS
jgi:hypothetical protein